MKKWKCRVGLKTIWTGIVVEASNEDEALDIATEITATSSREPSNEFFCDCFAEEVEE